MTLFSNSTLVDSLVILAASLVLAKLVFDRRSSRLAAFRGPRSNNFLLGRLPELINDTPTTVDRWISEYGFVFKVPIGLGTNRVVIADPKAVAHIFANDSFGYLRSSLGKTLSRNFIGNSMISADKDDHRRQRRATAPAFTNSALRDTMSIFYDSAYKLKTAWDALFESHDEVTIDVQQWINKVTLDSMGIAGFAHDFRSLDGHKSPVSETFDALLEDNSFRVLIVIAGFFPQVFNLPLKRTKVLRGMKNMFSDIAHGLLEKSQQEKDSSGVEIDRSILGFLLKGRSQNSNFKLLQDEVVGQVGLVRLANSWGGCSNTIRRSCALSNGIVLACLPFPCRQGLFLFAGYETTANSLSWALIELARHPEKQEKLRQELFQFSNEDPTWDQVVTGTKCPYLDAVVHESLRLHPPAEVLQRVAAKDDVIPLSFPMQSSGKTVDSAIIPEGTTVIIPFVYMNRSEVFWGPNAKEFFPERWLEENPYPSKDFSSYRHLYSFSDGPRICLGRMFALAEFKAVLSVLIRNFKFELPSGPDTPIGTHRGILPRPKLADEVGCVLTMRVRQMAG